MTSVCSILAKLIFAVSSIHLRGSSYKMYVLESRK